MPLLYKSKLNPWPVIGYGILASLLLPGLFCLILFSTTNYLQTLVPGDRAAGWADCFVAIVAGSWGLYMAVRNRQTIRIDEQNIFVGKRQIPFSEIESLQVLGREWRGKGWWNTYDETVVIILSSKEEIHIKADNYRNGSLMRAVCEKIDTNIKLGVLN